MADGYMPQPDSGDNCCDCPSRTSPCDDCGGPSGPCCLPDGTCTTETSSDCIAAGGTPTSDCNECCGACFCFESGAFEDGMGNFWTVQTTSCLGVTTYSGPTTAGAKFRTFHEVNTCCPGVPGDGQDCTLVMVCIPGHDGGTPVCQENSSPGCDTPPTCLVFSTVITLSDPCP